MKKNRGVRATSSVTADDAVDRRDELRADGSFPIVGVGASAGGLEASGVLTLGPRPKTRAPHRSIDFFLERLAEDQRARAIGVILSGTATDGTLGLAASFQPGVILLDIGLPVMNGHEAARRIWEQQRDNAPVLMARTGWGQDDSRRRSEEAGFDAHLVKPVDEAVLGKLLAGIGAGKQRRQR